MKKTLMVLLVGLVLPLASVFAAETKMTAADGPVVIGLSVPLLQFPLFAAINPASKVTVGYDAIPDAFQYMKDGKLSATIDQFPGKQGCQALEVLVGYIKNQTKPPKEVIPIDPALVTKAP